MPKTTYRDVRVRADWPWDRAQIAGRQFYKHEAVSLRDEELTDEIKNSPILEFSPEHGEPESPSVVVPHPTASGEAEGGRTDGANSEEGGIDEETANDADAVSDTGEAQAEHRERKPRRPKGG